MKIYISSDIEGTCGFSAMDEGRIGAPNNDYFRHQMSMEVAAVCRGASKSGANEILVHDAHGTARNIDPAVLPQNVCLMRGSVGDPYAMMSGLQDGGYDAAMLTGFHSGVGSDQNPASHTFNTLTVGLWLNGVPLSEMMFDVFTAASLQVPTCFVCGDEGLCQTAKELVPNITAISPLKGRGAASISIHPQLALEHIEDAAAKALSGDYKNCFPKKPDSFTLRMQFRSHLDAYFNHFYPGIVMLNSTTLEYTAKDWYDILVMVHFVLDK